MRATFDPARTPAATDAWGLSALPPGARDLGSPEYCAVSLERSRRRREAAGSRGLAGRCPAGPVPVALAAIALGASSVTVAATAQAAPRAAAANLDLRRGSTGPDVAALQRALGISADGIFGRGTERAVRRYQRRQGIPATGYVGPMTTAALGLRPSGRRTATRRSRRGPARTVTVRLDRRTARAMQAALGVTVDGIVGPRTRAALRRFEAAHGLPADGRPDADALAALGVMAGGEAEQGATPQALAAPGAGAQAALQAALSKVGAPYRSAGTGPSSFDCSGLTLWAFKQAGIRLPRTSYDQYGAGTRVRRSQIQPGDLVFFDANGPGASHVGIATSPTTAVSATSHGVREHPITTGYWGGHYVGARRLT